MKKGVRRLLLMAASAMMTLISLPMSALSTEQAEQFVNQATSELEALSSSGQSGAAMQDSVRVFFRSYTDGATVARTVIGGPWRGMSDAQKRDYVSAFEAYVVRKYAGKFDVLRDGTAEVKSAQDAGSAGIVVNAEFVRDVGLPVDLDFQVSSQNGSPKILDLRLEGDSMISQERQIIRSLLEQNGNDVDALIVTLSTQ